MDGHRICTTLLTIPNRFSRQRKSSRLTKTWRLRKIQSCHLRHQLGHRTLPIRCSKFHSFGHGRLDIRTRIFTAAFNTPVLITPEIHNSGHGLLDTRTRSFIVAFSNLVLRSLGHGRLGTRLRPSAADFNSFADAIYLRMLRICDKSHTVWEWLVELQRFISFVQGVIWVAQIV